jgi:polyisoprenoid-binding protein YceI
MKLFLILIIYSGVLFSRTHLIWDSNKDHSSIRFKVSYLSFSKIEGKFSKFWGRIYYDDDGELPKRIEFSIDPSTVDTGSRIRDGHLKSDDFFSVKKYPIIRFQGSKILAGAPNEFLVKGRLYLKDIIVPHEVLIILSPKIKDSWGFTNRFVKFKTIVSRSNLGLDWNRSLKGNQLLVGDKVELLGELQIQPLNKLTPPSKHMIPDINKILKKTVTTESSESLSQKEYDPLIKEIMPLKIKYSRKEVKSPISKSKHDYPFILSLIILIQLSFLGIIKIKDFIDKSKVSNRIKKTAIITVLYLEAWAIFIIYKVTLI